MAHRGCEVVDFAIAKLIWAWVPKLEGTEHQGPNEASFLLPSICIYIVQAISQSFQLGIVRKGAPGFESWTRSRGEGGGPQALKKIYYLG
jgi:hypothetical protein